ncbi:MAG: AAA-like domain-containing protein, partial [Bacteroidota bacterium]
MERFFNTAGPIKPEWHYHVPTDTRWDYRNVVSLIQQSKYFILHAPRQTGKTSGLLSLMHYLNQSEQFEALYANIEPAQAAREDVPAAMAAIAGKIASRHELYHNNNLLSSNWNNIYEKSKPHQVIEDLLTFWTKNASKPTILFLDEVDTLIGDTLISLLRQLRAGYDKRPEFFPQSIILCGVRDIRDYRIHSSRSKEIITGGSAFNIKAESLRLSNFTKDQIAQLYQ